MIRATTRNARVVGRTMGRADNLNEVLRRHHSVAERCLSPLGRRLCYPQGGIPAQAAEAKGCQYNATIGQVTNDDGSASALSCMAEQITGLPPEEVFLYAPQGGRPDLRHLWKTRLEQRIGCAMSLPLVTSGLTHGISIAADLFADSQTDVFVPSPGWCNYTQIFQTRRGARVHPVSFMTGSPHKWDTSGLLHRLSKVKHKAIVVFNSPNNPMGYTPTIEEAREFTRALSTVTCPLVVICDDAYQGMVWESGLAQDGCFGDLTRCDNLLAVKVDGATKELFFFGGRVGFISFGVDGEAGAVLEEKARALARATVSSISAPAQALVCRALLSPDLESQQAHLRDALRQRYVALKEAISDSNLRHWPFNSAFFALFDVGEQCDTIRSRLIANSIGVVSFGDVGGLRLSYSTLRASDLAHVVDGIASAVRG